MKPALVFSLLFLLCSAFTVEAQVASKAKPAQTIARDLEFRSLDGDTKIRMSDYENQTIVIVIWASWCPPCRLALTELTKMKRESFSKTPYPIIALSIEDPASAEADLKQTLDVINYTELSGWIDERAPLLQGRKSIPQILIVKNLKVLKRTIAWHPNNVNAIRKALTMALRASS